ncbi:hypothetical protein EVAR_25667_1 [Eumeta japonica]|uniref:Uncharacterized protein n=1 Tax=Eumeta variegata TaxID=151549 RepID=A0A4C1WEG0_EUMVA|nr:hypothetical protein EVAR_25667_1 [Eumeta japonica]
MDSPSKEYDFIIRSDAVKFGCPNRIPFYVLRVVLKSTGEKLSTFTRPASKLRARRRSNALRGRCGADGRPFSSL